MTETTTTEAFADKYIRQCIEEAITSQAHNSGRMPAVIAEQPTFREREKHWAPYPMHLNAELWYSCMAHMLTRVQEVDPVLADHIADESHRYLDDGSLLSEFMWQWGAERGIDPEAIFDDAKARYASRVDNPRIVPAIDSSAVVTEQLVGAWDRGYDAGQQDEFDAREGNEHENTANPYRATGAASGRVVVDGRAAYVRAASALSQLVILANNEGAEFALDKTLGALQSAVADLGVAVS